MTGSKVATTRWASPMPARRCRIWWTPSRAAGGPTYSFAFAEGEVGTQGGVPSGNIRNAFLYNEERVTAVEITTLEVPELTAFGVTDPGDLCRHARSAAGHVRVQR